MSFAHRTSFLNLIFTLCLILFLTACSGGFTVEPTNSLVFSDTPAQQQSETVGPTQTPYVITATPGMLADSPVSEGVFFLSIAEVGYYHLFAYSPPSLALTRLTSGNWDDITPALSPDGNYLAFSSHRNGFWDLYTLNLQSGETLRLTDSTEYKAAPTWSLPDGAFIAYETYVDGNLEIYIRSVTDVSQVFRLTNDPAQDTSPAWSPQGRQIAFVSNRSGRPAIWLADLDHAGQFINVSDDSKMSLSHPAWSPDGSRLAWAATDPDSGLTSLYIWDVLAPNAPARWAGSGDWPIWQDNETLASRLPAPNQTYITSYLTIGSPYLPPMLLPGSLNGLGYGYSSSALPGPFLQSAQVTQVVPQTSDIDPHPALPGGRMALVSLTDTTATNPQLAEFAYPSFQALRLQVVAYTGWDALGNLENAFVPLTTPMDPGLGEDWLFTGRAITLNPALVQARYMVVVREDFGQQVYWRIYLHTSEQDGSQGIPLTRLPWDFSARSSSSSAYENGGKLMDFIPSGYWLDLTSLAVQYGWERLPALLNWRSYYSGTKLNELAYTQGMDWQSAMLQLYPPEVLITPTLIVPPTRTPTRTSMWYRSPTPSSTQTPSLNATP